ncbi:hypothetical protein B8A22_04390 [Staphylococcus aureus]|nr:hypothetical protein B8A22_04390 [Staphylococcus aureus]ORT79312.1 hypothetical protein B6V77_04695 [Staphylococcus aureus]
MSVEFLFEILYVGLRSQLLPI